MWFERRCRAFATAPVPLPRPVHVRCARRARAAAATELTLSRTSTTLNRLGREAQTVDGALDRRPPSPILSMTSATRWRSRSVGDAAILHCTSSPTLSRDAARLAKCRCGGTESGVLDRNAETPMTADGRGNERGPGEAALVEEFLAEYPPNHELWEGGWLALFNEWTDGSDPDVTTARRRILLHAAITVRARGGAVNDAHIAEAVQTLSGDD